MYYLDASDKLFSGIKGMRSGYYALNDRKRWVFVRQAGDIDSTIPAKDVRTRDGNIYKSTDWEFYERWNDADAEEAPRKVASILQGKGTKRFEKSYLITDKETKAQILDLDSPDEVNSGFKIYKTNPKEIVDAFTNGSIIDATPIMLTTRADKDGNIFPTGKSQINFTNDDAKVEGFSVEVSNDNVDAFNQFFQEQGIEVKKVEQEVDELTQVQQEFKEAGGLGQSFSMGREATGETSSVSNADKRDEIARLSKEFGLEGRKDLKIIITDKASEWGVERDVSGLAGLYSDNTAYFALDQIKDVEDASKTFVHEVGIHYGLPRMMGDAEYQDFLGWVESSFPEQVAEYSDSQRPAEEFIANFAEEVSPTSTPSVFESIVTKLLEYLRKIPVVGDIFSKMTKMELTKFSRDAILGVKDPDKRTVKQSVVMTKRVITDKSHPMLSNKGREALSLVFPDQEPKLTIQNIKKGFKNKVIAKVFDSLKPIETELGKDYYILARLARRAEGVMTAMLEYGGIKVIKDKLTDPDKKYLSLDVDMNKKGLFEILKPLGSDAERKQFFGWLAYSRANELAKEGRENYFPPEMIKEGIKFDQGRVLDVTTGNYTDRASLYKRISKEYQKFNEQVVDIGVRFGLFKKNIADAWEKQFYVPFFRVLEEDARDNQFVGPANYSGLVNQKGVERLKGTDAPINNPFDNILLNAFHIVDASLKNRAAVDAIDAALKIVDPATGATIARKLKGSAKDSVRILRDGVEEYYQISDKMLFEALTSQHYQNVNFPGMDFAIKAKRYFTYGTTFGLPFKIRNAIRDTISTSGTTTIGYNVFDNFFGGIGRLKDQEMKARMLVTGGYIQFGHLSSGDADFARKILERNLDSRYILNNPDAQANLKGAMQKFGRMFKQVVGRYDDWGNELENANRASLFAKESAKRGSNLLAAYYARDILDFSLSGSSTTVRMFNQLLPFTNARLQGLYKMGRSAKENPEIFFTVAGAVALAMLGNYLAYKDDEEWKSREEWDKDTYFWFKVPGTDNAFRIPTPHEFGFLGNVAWRSYAAVFDEDPIHRHLFAERMTALIKHELALDPTPQLIKPIKEIMTDRNEFTGRNIEGPALRRLSPTERKRLWTSQSAIGASKLLNKVPWDKVQLSPVQIEHLIKGYFGWIGQQGLFLSDLAVRMTGDYPDLPGQKLSEFPLAREFFQTTPIKNTTYGNMFYEQLKEMEQAYADIQLNKRIGDYERANELAETNQEKLYLRKIFNRKQDIIQEFNNRIKLIQNDRFMPADMKRQQIDRIEQMRNNILRNVVRQYIAVD